MRRFFSIGFILLSATAYVLLLNYYTESKIVLQKTSTLLIAALLIILVLYPLFIKKLHISFYTKYILLFVSCIFLELIIISTGGVISPLFILIHLFTIAVGFVFGFPIAILYLFIVLFSLFAEIFMAQSYSIYLLEGSPVFILQLASIIPILPITYIISQEYNLKNKLAEKLNIRIKTDEAIFENLKELIIITDHNMMILSVNDIVERILQVSKFDLIGKNIFDALLMSDAYGQLVNRDTFFVHGKREIKKYKNNFTIFKSNNPYRKIQIHIKPTLNIEGNISQYSFIFSSDKTSDIFTNIEESRAKYEALVEELKIELGKDTLRGLKSKLIILEKIENDMYLMRELEHSLLKENKSRIDLAKLTYETVLHEKEYANALQTTLDFTIHDFGHKDIAPFTVESYPVTPTQLTGPFFTVKCDVKLLEIYLEKIIDLAVITASNIHGGKVHAGIKRKGKSAFEIIVASTCPELDIGLVKDNIFLAYYGKLNSKINLVKGSGLEGFLIKTIKEIMNVPMEISYVDNNLIFTTIIKSR